MEYTMLSAFLICCSLSSAFSFAIGFYENDIIFFMIGLLLALASLIIFLKVKKNKNNSIF